IVAQWRHQADAFGRRQLLVLGNLDLQPAFLSLPQGDIPGRRGLPDGHGAGFGQLLEQKGNLVTLVVEDTQVGKAVVRARVDVAVQKRSKDLFLLQIAGLNSVDETRLLGGYTGDERDRDQPHCGSWYALHGLPSPSAPSARGAMANVWRYLR